jgi:hypothetical protein
MMHRSVARQRGVSILGVFLLVGVLAALGVLGARVVPTVLEHDAIQGAIAKARQGQTPEEIRRLFDRAAEIEGIKSISGKDLEITRDSAGQVLINYAYDREFRLGGPAFLLIKYSNRST